MIFEIWSVTDRIFSHFGPSLPFTPLTAQKMKISNKWKTPGDMISSFYTSVPKIKIICFTVSEIWRMTDVIVTFPFYHLTAQKMKILKK